MDSIAESFAKCFVADFIFSLSRTTDDKNANGGRFFIAKNRFGVDGRVFPIFMDTSISQIKILPPASTDELITEDGDGEIKNSQRETYKKLRRDK
jgi:hypothetical protein